MAPKGLRFQSGAHTKRLEATTRVGALLTHSMSALVIGSLAAISVSYASENPKLDYDDIPALVSKQNQRVRGAQSFAQAAESQTGYLARSYLPSLSVEGGGETFQTGAFSTMSQPYGSVTSKVNVFRSGRDGLEEGAREGQAQAQVMEREQVYATELSEARKAFWNVVLRKHILQIYYDAKEANEKNMRAAEKRIQVGLTSETDRIEFQLARIQIDQEITKLALDAENGERTLAAFLGMPENTRFDVVSDIPHDHDNDLYSLALDVTTQRNVRQLVAKQDVSIARRSQANRWWTPSVDIYASYGLFTVRERESLAMRDRFEGVVGLRISMDLFDGLQSRTTAKGLALEADGFENQAMQTARDLRARIENAKKEIKVTHDLIHSAEENAQQGKIYLSRTLAEYAKGVKNSPDVLSATLRYVDYRRRVAELRRDYQAVKADLLAIIGK